MSKPNNTLLTELDSIVSESRNPRTMDIDQLSTLAVLQKINAEDQLVADAVEQALVPIKNATDAAIASLKQGGRLIYIGAGTSGRLGILDAVECRPTFSVPDNLVIGLIAGGERALTHAVEGAEDDKLAGERDLAQIDLQHNDMVIGLAASGRTPYVIGALEYANNLSCSTAAIVCNPTAPLLKIAKIGICLNVGPECLTGSTRMKSGSAQKMALNMISTATMIKLGKVYENLMVDVNASNKKLVARALNIVMQASNCSEETAKLALSQANNSAKLAILMILTNSDAKTASQFLQSNKGYLRAAQQDANNLPGA